MVAHEDFITVLNASPDGKWFATGSNDSTVVLWDAQNPATTPLDWLAHDRRVSDVAFSPNSTYLLTVGGDITPKLWDVSSDIGRLVASMNGHDDYIRRCAWASTSALFATGSFDGSVRVWHGPSVGENAFQECYVVRDPGAGPLLHTLRFSPSARTLVTIHLPLPGEADGVPDWHIWKLGADPDTLPVTLDEPKDSTFVAAAVDSTSRCLVAASRDGSEIRLWDFETGKARVVAPPVASFSGGLTKTLLSPDGRHLLMEVGFLETYHLLELETHRITTLSSDTMLHFPCFSPDEQYIATASDAGVRLWRTSDCSCAAVLAEEVTGPGHPAALLTFSGDGRSLAVGDRSGDVRIYKMEDFLWLDRQ